MKTQNLYLKTLALLFAVYFIDKSFLSMSKNLQDKITSGIEGTLDLANKTTLEAARKLNPDNLSAIQDMVRQAYNKQLLDLHKTEAIKAITKFITDAIKAPDYCNIV